MADPIPQIYVEAPWPGFMQKRDVRVTQDDEVEIALGRQFLDGPCIQYLRASLFRIIWAPSPGFRLGDEGGQSRADVRMEPTEEPPSASTVEPGLQDPVREVAPAQAVAMSDEGSHSRQIPYHRASLEREPDVFRQEFAAPPIMVPPHEGHGKTPIDEIGERSEGSRVSAWNDRAVLEPEVEQIAVEDQFGRTVCGVLQPAHEHSLGLGSYGPEVNVAGQMNGFL